MVDPQEIDEYETFDREDGVVINGDLFDVLPELPDDHYHAVVCDPPYGFPGDVADDTEWDNFRRARNPADVERDNAGGRLSAKAPASGAETNSYNFHEWCTRWAEEVKRVLKPGGHLLAFGGDKTHHRLFSGIEDAGFEIRDSILWLHIQGFPKGQNIEKAIDREKGAERGVTGVSSGPNNSEYDGDRYTEERETRFGDVQDQPEQTEPATEEAAEWEGWRSQLKPCSEFVCVARKPLGGDTIAENMMEHGTGAYNVDAGRIGNQGGHIHPGTEDNSETVNAYGDGLNDTRSVPAEELGREGEPSADETYTEEGSTNYSNEPGPRGGDSMGRYPPNVAVDEGVADALDAGRREDASSSHSGDYTAATGDIYGDYDDADYEPPEYDEDERLGPSRAYFTSKASKADRTMDGEVEQMHPTCKPRDLCEWLVTLVTAPGQKVLDPFGGSGTTGIACEALGEHGDGVREFTLVERDEDYFEIIQDRLNAHIVSSGDVLEDF